MNIYVVLTDAKVNKVRTIVLIPFIFMTLLIYEFLGGSMFAM